MTTQAEKAARFLELHRPGSPLLMPNAWDAGSAKLFASLGFEAVATTSSGFAATLGRLDYGVERDEAVAHGAALAAATDVPVSADLEDCFASEPEGVAETIRRAVGAGLAGGSVEDFTGNRDDPIHDLALATERVAAAADAAHAGPVHFVLTARAEARLHGLDDLDAIVERLRAYQDAGADVLFAPGVTSPEEVRRLTDAVDLPVNVLPRPGTTIAELADAGAARISVGGSLAFLALGAVADAARELREDGTLGFLERARAGAKTARAAFSD